LANKSSFSNVIALKKVKESHENGPFDFAIEQLKHPSHANNKPNLVLLIFR
jgi:hypothetical protein